MADQRPKPAGIIRLAILATAAENHFKMNVPALACRIFARKRS
jgi:hypothetical protein